MSGRELLYPAYGYDERGRAEVLAMFFTYSDAADFAMHPEFERRNIYMATPIYDRRERGYRPPTKPSGYAEWIMEIDLRHDGGRIAA